MAVNESETLNRSFTIILAVHQPYSICDLNPVYTALFASGSTVTFL